MNPASPIRLHILSDLHLEFGEMGLPDVRADVVVLAGDVDTRMNGLGWILDQRNVVPVVYVAGNHEFYGDRYPRLLDKLRGEAAGTHVHFLESGHLVVELEAP